VTDQFDAGSDAVTWDVERGLLPGLPAPVGALGKLVEGKGLLAPLVTKLQFWWRDGNIPLLRDISIQARFTLLIAVAVAAGVLMGAVHLQGERRISAAIEDQSEFQWIDAKANGMRAGALSMQTAANGLIDERQTKFVTEFESNTEVVQTAIKAVKASPNMASRAADIANLERALGDLSGQFKKVVAALQLQGLSDHDGLRFRLSASVKAIESELALWPNTDDLKTRLLRLRQAEKDFMISQDQSDLGKYHKFALEFDLALDSAQIAPSTKENFHSLAARYSADMADYGQATLELQQQITQLRAKFTALQPGIIAFAAVAQDGMTEATSRQNRTRAEVGRFTAIVGLFALLAFIGVGLVSGRSISRPVLAMEKAMHRLAEGEHDVAIPGTERADEVGLMAKAVGIFRDNAKVMARLRAAQDEAQKAREKRSIYLEQLIVKFDGDIGAIIGAVAQSASKGEVTAREMENFVGQTITRMRSVDESSGQATSHVQTMAAAAEQLAFSVSEISQRVSHASVLSNQAAEAATRTDAIVASLSEVTNRIDSVVTFIQTLATQTRMLALNAAIEAARAGESGAGFSVVADEVRKLATQTTQATDEIASQIDAVQVAGSDAAEAIRDIAMAVGKVNELTQAIAASVEEQGAATNEIARSAQQAAQSTTEVAASITWVVNEAGAMQVASGHVLASSSHLTNQSQVLRVVVDDFLLGVNEDELTPVTSS